MMIMLEKPPRGVRCRLHSVSENTSFAKVGPDVG